MNNNLNGLNLDNSNSINQTNNKTTREAQYQDTQLYQDTQKVREEALSSTIAGEPTLPDLKLPEQSIDINDATITKNFTTRDQVMSKIGLMDDKGNYTDTYTNYVNQGGQPVQGYEWAHQEILKQEGYDNIFKKVEDGEMSYDTALMEAYGKDILATSFNIDTSSVAYWKNKFLNEDYSNPFANRYLMSQVLQAAEEYHTARQAGQFAHSNIADTQLQNLVGTEVDDLSAQKIIDLFPGMSELSNDIDDKEFRRALHNGQIDAQMRMTQDADGNYYYLHTDGKLYILDGQSGDGHGTLKKKADGTLEGIDLNGNGVVTTGRSFLSGFSGVFTGIIDLGAMALDIVDDVIPVSALWTGGEDLGFWDGIDKDDFFGYANDFDSWMNDNADLLVGNGYVDLSSEITGQDLWNFVGNMTGTIAGTMTLAGIIGAVGDAGTATTAASKGKGLMGYGQKLVDTGHTFSGNLIKGTGTVLKWQTGNIGSYSDAALKGSGAIWGRRLGAAAVANGKNFLQDSRRLMTQASLYDEGASDWDILRRTAMVSMINTGIDTLISGGMDDNQWQAYTGRNTITKKATTDLIADTTSKELVKEFNEQTKGAFKNYLNSRRWVIAFNSAGDLLGNMLTGGISTLNSLEKGKLTEFDVMKAISNSFTNPGTWGRSLVNTLWYSTRSQVREWNAGMENVGLVHQEVLNTLDAKIRDAKGKPGDQDTLMKVRTAYVNAIKESQAQTYEGRIFAGMQFLADKLAPTDGTEVPKILTDAFEKVCSPIMVAKSKEMFVAAEAYYVAMQNRVEDVASLTGNKIPLYKKIAGVFKKKSQNEANTEVQQNQKGFEPGRITRAKRWLTGESGRDASLAAQEYKNQAFNADLERLSALLPSEQMIEAMQRNKDITNGREKDDRLRTVSGYNLAKDNTELFAKVAKKIGAKEAGNGLFYYIPQETSNSEEASLHKAALNTLANLGYIQKVEGIGIDNFYQFKPYSDQIDFISASAMNEFVHSSIFALGCTDDLSVKENIFVDLGKNLFTENANDVQKASVLASILTNLTKQNKNNDKILLSTDEAGLIFLRLQDAGLIKSSLKYSDNISADQSLSYMTELGNVMLAIQKDKGYTIDLSDPRTEKVLQDLSKEKKYEKSIKKLFELKENNPEAFQNGSMYNKMKFIQSHFEGQLKSMLPLDVILSDKENPEYIDLYLKQLGFNKDDFEQYKKTDEYKEIIKLAENFDKIYANGKTVTIDNGNIIYIDLEKFQGKSTTEFVKKIFQQAIPSFKNIDKLEDFREYSAGMYNDLIAKNKATQNNGSLIAFDLNTDSERFRSFMSDFGYDIQGRNPEEIKNNLSNIKGLTNFKGDSIVLNIPRVQNVDQLKDELLSSVVTVGNDSISLRELQEVKYKNKLIQKQDIDRAMMDLITVKNIDPSIQVTLKQAPLIQYVPFEQPIAGEKYNYTLPIATALFSTTETLGKQAGKEASRTGKNLAYILTRSAGVPVDYNTDLETYFILEQIANNICNKDLAKHSNIHLSQEESTYLKKNNLVKYTEQFKVHNPDAIWEITGTGDKYLSLSKDFTTRELMEYVTSKNFNVHKMLPMLLTELPEDERGKQGIIDAFATHTTKGLQENLPGQNRETGLQVLNIRLPWDDGNNSRYAMFLKNIFGNTDVEYNPLKNANFKLNPEGTKNKSFEEWYEKAATSRDPLDILAKQYVDTYNDMVHQNTNTDGKYDNWTLLAATPKTRIALLEELEKGNTTASKDLVNKLKAMFLPAKAKSYGDTDESFTVKGGSYVPNSYVGKASNPEQIAISEQRIANSMGGYNNLEVSDTKWINADTVQQALNELNAIKENLDNEYSREFYSMYNAPQYKENDMLKLFKGVASSDGYIRIQDADEIANLIGDAQYNADSRYPTSYRIKDSMIPALQKLWGENYVKACDVIFKQALAFNKLDQASGKTFDHMTVTGQGSSIETSSLSGTYGAIPKDLGKDTIDRSEVENENLDAFTSYIKNAARKKYLDGEDRFNYVLDTTKDFLNNEAVDKLQDSIMKDRYLFTSAPFTTEVGQYAYAHNFIGQMKSTIATFQKLKEQFPSANDNDLMLTAQHFINLHRGVDYVGETANFMIVKNGQLTNADMEEYASANYQDLLFNIQKGYKDLKGATLIKVSSQDIDNVAGLQMSFKTIENESDYKDLITDLYRNFILENSNYLRTKSKMSPEELELAIFGEKVNPSKIQEIINNVPAENMSQIQKYNKLYNTMEERTNILGLSKADFMQAIKGLDTISINDAARNAIQKSLGDEYEPSKAVDKTFKSLIFGFGNIETMDDDKRTKIRELQQEVLEAFKPVEGESQTPYQQALTLIASNIASKDDAATYDLLTRNRTLTDMYHETINDNIKDGFAINVTLDKSRKVKRLDSNVLTNLRDAIEANDSTKTDVKIITTFDTETGLVLNGNESDRTIFNVGLKVREADGNGGWKVTRYNIFVNYEPSDLTEADSKAFREKFVKANILDATDKRAVEFRESNEGYKNTYQTYLDIKNNILTEGPDQVLYLRPDEIKSFITNLHANKKGMFVGYNSSSADIPWMINANMIDKDFFKTTDHVDVKVLGDTSLRTQVSGKKDDRAEQYGISIADAHGGLSDAEITEDLLLKTISDTYNIVKIRNTKYNEIMKLLEDNNIKLTGEDLTKVLSTIDSKLQELKTPEVQDMFGYHKDITTDTVTAANDVMLYMINKRLANTRYELYDKMIEGNYLSAKALKALDENKQDVINKMWSFVSNNGIPKETFLYEVLKEVKISGNDMNALLETLGNEARISHILERMGLDSSKFTNYQEDPKLLFSSNPWDDSELNKEMFNNYNTYKRNRIFLSTFKDITDALRFSNDADKRAFVNELGKIYSFREGLDPKDFLKDDVYLINNRITQMYKEYLYNHYGDTDAVLASSRKGLYDLIDATPIGSVITDGISNTNIKIDSSMIVLSPEQFKNLMGVSIEDYKGPKELYSQLLIQPSDSNDKMLTRRIVVNPELKGRYMQVPETVIETLGSRDFDGDHLSLLKPDDYSQQALKLYSQEIYKIHNTQEYVLDYLRKAGLGYKDYKEKSLVINTIGKDEEVLDLCKKANVQLEKGKDISKLTKDFEDLISKKFPDSDLEKVKKDLWLVEKDLYLDTGNTEPIRYINNPAIYFGDAKRKITLDGKEIDIDLSYSGEQRLKAETSQLTNKYLYNFIDQTTGVTQKYAINYIDNINIKNPWTDLLASGIYGSDTVYKYWQNIGDLPEEQKVEFIKGLEKTIKDTITESYSDTNYWKDVERSLTTNLDKIKSELDSGDINTAFSSYDRLLRSIEGIQRKKLNSSELLSALTTPEMLEFYRVQEDKLNKTKNNINLYNELAKQSKWFPSDNNYGEVTTYTMNSMINDLVSKYSDQYNQNVFDNGPKLDAFVITRFEDDPSSEAGTSGIGEDTIIINNNVPSNRKLVGYSRVIYPLGGEKVSKDIQEGKFYRKGQTLSIGNSNIKLKKDSYIAAITPKEVIVAQVGFLDNDFKMITNFGGKGVVNSSYTTDSDYQILLNKPNVDKLPFSYNKSVDTTDRVITITGPNGEKIKAHGYPVHGVSAVVTEDTSSWIKAKDRKLDALHVVMDSNTINGILDFGAKFEDGNLSTNIEAYRDLRNSVYKPYKDVQTTNFLPVLNRTKISYIINRLSDSELQKAFNTSLDADTLRYRLTHNMYLATDKYTSIAYTLGKKYSNLIDDSFGKRLFGPEGLSLIGDYKRSRLSDANIYKETSKNDVAAQASFNEDGTSNLTSYKARVVHLSPDEMNLGKGYTNVEDYYVSPFDFFNLVTGGRSELNSFNVKELIKEGKLPYGTFIPDTADMENNFRNFQSNLTIKDNELQKSISQGQSSKTATVAEKANLIGAHPIEVSLAEPERNEIEYDVHNGFNNEVMNLLNSTDIDTKYGYSKLALMLYQLQNLNRNQTLREKQESLSNNTKLYGTYDNKLALDYTDDGNVELKLSQGSLLTGTAKELYNKIKNSIYNYSTWNALNDTSKEKETLNAEALDKNINKTSYRKGQNKYKKQLDEIWSELQNDFYDSKTGEIKEVNPADVKTPSEIQPVRILEGGEESILEKSVWGRQGLKEDSKLGVELTVAMKHTKAGAAFLEQECMRDLNEFETIAKSQMSDEEIKNFAVVQALYHGRDADNIKDALRVHNFKSMEEVDNLYNEYNYSYPQVVLAFNKHLDNLTRISNQIAKETGEPMGQCLIALIAPYRSTDKAYNQSKARSIISNALGLRRYDPSYKSNAQRGTLEFDIWNSSKSIIKELSTMHQAKILKDSLIKQDLLKNDTLLDNVSKILDDEVQTADDKLYIEQTPEQQQIQNTIIDVIKDLTGMTIHRNSYKYTFKQYKDMYKDINEHLSALKQNFYSAIGKQDVVSYTDFAKLADDTSESMNVRDAAKAVANFYYAKMLVGQCMIQSNPKFANKLGSYIASLKDEGYSLVNQYGQKYTRGGVVKPLSASSMANLIENMEISYNSYNETMWNQFVLEKIISGDVYLLKNDVADYLDSHMYTQEIPSNTMKTLSGIAKWSSALQMALPSKILNRLFSFTGFDYNMALTYDLSSIKFFGPARRELLAAFQSNGTNISDTLKEYLEREGQPIGLTGKDPITFSEELNGPDKIMKVLNTLTDPLEFQNHLGRYAIYLTAKKSFDEGKPNYGPVYYAKDAIDALDNNADKAMMVMDYMLGSPGGFPELSKKTKGLMLYTTFPMNFARTMGAYGMSLGKLFSEGFNQDNAKYWMKSAAVPSMALAGITGFSMLFTSWICDLLGIEEDEKDKLVHDLSTIDPVGTLISGSPQKSSSSMNPVENFNSMFVEPFTNPRNKDVFQKLFGVVNTNVLSHLNPAMKIPVEVMSGYDIYGSSLMNTKYQYNNIENGMRKVLGSVFGTNVGNEIVMQKKINKYSKDAGDYDYLLTGLRRGVAASLGNEKTYKKDTTNYYNRLTDIRNYKYKLSDGSYNDEVEDYVNASSMERIRNYKSKYGTYNEKNYKEMDAMLRKMMKNKEEPATIYAYIISKYNDGVDEATIKAVLNNHSIVRKLDSLKENKAEYLSSLSSEEYKNLLKAIQYENTYYPLLQKLFPNASSSSYKKVYYKKPYYSSTGGSSYYPKTYVPSPRRYYPSNSYSNNKYKTYNPRARINKVDVDISPQMGVWTNDYNKVVDLQHWKDQNYNRTKPLSHGGGK